MFRLMMRSFARGYGKKMGYIAARKTSWLAIPVLLFIVLIGMMEMGLISLPGAPELQHYLLGAFR